MSLLHLVVIAVVQGVTEFLPVSSSGHLVLIHHLSGWPDQGLAIDVAAHAGSLAAVIVYFRRDMAALAGAGLAVLAGREHPDRRLLWLLFAASVPALAAGAALASRADDLLRGLETIAWTMTLGAFALYAADRFGSRARRLGDMRPGDAVIVGLAQALALVPGVSRAGAAVTAARALGFSRTDAARFSMLLSVPVILGASTVQALKLATGGAAGGGLWSDALAVAALSGLAAFVAVGALMRWLAHASFTPLVVYRLALGLTLLALVYL